ncbi:hypothetical protein [Agrococcus beijingensis]|uniref:hypothetical protein n=1 Tax=Agrococcus beijingensis TaxID=3068634 RepID=UPI002740FE18|nr:hypothetical protein [Agrococcus sp. REN33]
MAELLQNDATAGATPVPVQPKLYRSLRTGRIVTEGERIAAARTRVVADRRRGVETAAWIVELAKQSA